MKFMITVTFKAVVVLAGCIGLLYWMIAALSYAGSPEEAIRNKLGHVNVQYSVIQDDYIDREGSARYYIRESNGSVTDSIPHIFYLRHAAAGWYITNSGNAP